MSVIRLEEEHSIKKIGYPSGEMPKRWGQSSEIATALKPISGIQRVLSS